MNIAVSVTDTATTSGPAARVAIAAAGAVLLWLASLHVLSPEFDPSWRVVSEYANGRYCWVLSLMFASWALSSWALALTVWSQLNGDVEKPGFDPTTPCRRNNPPLESKGARRYEVHSDDDGYEV